MTAFRSFMRQFDRVRDATCLLLLVAMVLLIGLQVFYRYVLNDPLSWPEEIARNAFVWLVALGTVKLFRDRSNYVIDFFFMTLPERMRGAISIVYDVIALILFAMIFAGSWPVLKANAKITTAIGTPINVLYASFAVASLIVVFVITVSLVERLIERAQAERP